MNKVRTQKRVVVDEVRARIDTTATAVVTEYRGLTVAEISSLRRALREVDAEYKVLKNTLVRRAVAGTPSESLSEFLVGPTAIAWVRGDISAVAKILRDFAKLTPSLIVKGGVLDGKSLHARDLTALADLPSREVLLAQLAGLLASPMRQMAALFKAVPQNLAYGLSALIESKGGVAPAPVTVDVAEVVDATEAVESSNDVVPVGEVTEVAEVTEVTEVAEGPEVSADVTPE